MKINKKILSIPPHISTTWSHITSLHVKDQVLVVTLADGKLIEIPNLPPDDIEVIFATHAKAIEESQTTIMDRMMRPPTENPFRFGFTTFDGMMGMPLQHDPNQSNAPDLPKEVLEKIGTISKVLSPDEGVIAPQPVEDCNCIHCQISRTLNGLQHHEISTEDEIEVEELSFQQWEIVQTGDKMYTVINRLDQQEKYNVFLGNPIGCTCGHEGCEHILAVLKS
jgi:hypothetical protein